MKNSRIVSAYDTVTPTAQQKDRMLAAILQEADFQEAPVKQTKKKEPVIYTARPTKTSKKSAFMTIAASLAMVAVSAAVLAQMLKQPEGPAYVSPTETTASTDTIQNLVLPVDPSPYGTYNAIIADYVGYLNGTLSNPTTIPKKLREFIDSRDTSGLGWIVYDVNGDGIEELLISDGELIYQAITMDEVYGECPILFTTMEEEQYYRCQDGIFCKVSDYGSDYVQYDFFKVDMNRLDLNFRNLQEVVICDHGEYRIGRTEETAEPVDQSTGQWTLGEKYLRERLLVTPFLEEMQSEESAKNLTGFAPYDELLEQYYQATDESWDSTMLESNRMPPMIAEDRAYGILGWCTLDIDNNGQEELLISDGERIYDSYTITARGELAHLMSASFEKTAALCQNGIFRAVYPNEDRTVYIYYKVTDEFMAPEQTIVYENGAYRAGQTEVLAQPISKDEAGRIMSEYIQQELFVTRFMPRDPDAYDTDGTYAETLQLYRKALTEKWNMSKCEGNDISMMISYFTETPDDVGYTFLNLDGGEEELIITDGQRILDLYTVTDGEVRHVRSGTERINYYLVEDNWIFCRASAGAALTYFTLYQMMHPNVSEENGLVVREAYVYFYTNDPQNSWFYSPDGGNLGEPCGDFDAEARTEELMNDAQQLSFRRFN